MIYIVIAAGILAIIGITYLGNVFITEYQMENGIEEEGDMPC
jgi:hypothetical protein